MRIKIDMVVNSPQLRSRYYELERRERCTSSYHQRPWLSLVYNLFGRLEKGKKGLEEKE